ncbi:nucleotidyltransferase domain-containing protein [Candidatus Gracilibacteria bacterium]|nr:nucleotidyltransferase domain-containing protein [Candidatus Gracilibacteria bacterium]
MISDSLFIKAKFWASILGRMPGVLAVFLSGSLAQNKANKDSDIDFFVVAKKGQIWTARFFIFLILKISGQMRNSKNPTGKICPNHFITHQSLEIAEKDAYSANLFSHAKPLYDPQNLYPEFVQNNKHWWEKFGEQSPDTEKKERTVPIKKISSVSLFLEKWLRSWQIRKIKSNPEYKIPGAKIILEDTELRFHPHPKNKSFK